MKNFFFACSIVIVASFAFATYNASAETYTQDAGRLDTMVTNALMVQTGGPSQGSTQWVQQDVTSTYTGPIESFSVVMKGGDLITAVVHSSALSQMRHLEKAGS